MAAVGSVWCVGGDEVASVVTHEKAAVVAGLSKQGGIFFAIGFQG